MSVYVGSRDVVSVSGADAEAYLQGQISQDLAAIEPGSSAWSLVLEPQGKVVSWFRITCSSDGGSWLLDTDRGHGDALVERLRRFLLRVDVELDVARWDWHAHRGEEPSTLPPDAIVVAAPAGGQVGLDVLGPTLPPPDAAELSLDELERLRIEALVPAMGAELDESTIPAESGVVDSSVSFTKGCYTGQELVARIDSRGGNTPRRLRGLHGSDAAPTPGESLVLDGAEAGVITSVAPADDGWVGLGYVRRAALDAAELTTAAGTSVRVRPADEPA